MTTRRNFIAASSGLVLTTGTATVAAAAPASSGCPRPEIFDWHFDRARFNAILAKPARHKQCFGATKLEHATVIDSMSNSIAAYACYYPGESFQPVGVLYHSSAIALAMSSHVWNEFLVPWLRSNPQMAQEIPEAKAGKGNPYLLQTYVPGIVAAGGSFLVCHNAIEGFADGASTVLGESPQAVHDAIVAGLVPGAIAVPAGVMAINACQEAKFTYISS